MKKLCYYFKTPEVIKILIELKGRKCNEIKLLHLLKKLSVEKLDRFTCLDIDLNSLTEKEADCAMMFLCTEAIDLFELIIYENERILTNKEVKVAIQNKDYSDIMYYFKATDLFKRLDI